MRRSDIGVPGFRVLHEEHSEGSLCHSHPIASRKATKPRAHQAGAPPAPAWCKSQGKRAKHKKRGERAKKSLDTASYNRYYVNYQIWLTATLPPTPTRPSLAASSPSRSDSVSRLACRMHCVLAEMRTALQHPLNSVLLSAGNSWLGKFISWRLFAVLFRNRCTAGWREDRRRRRGGR